jgi:hypothetical protein
LEELPVSASFAFGHSEINRNGAKKPNTDKNAAEDTNEIHYINWSFLLQQSSPLLAELYCIASLHDILQHLRA